MIIQLPGYKGQQGHLRVETMILNEGVIGSMVLSEKNVPRLILDHRYCNVVSR